MSDYLGVAWAAEDRLVSVPARLVPRVSPRACAALLDMAGGVLAGARLVIEAGGGGMAGRILDRLPGEARLVCCGPPGDPRAVAERRPARDVLASCQGRADVVVSALPLAALPARDRAAVLVAAMAALVPGGVLLHVQYSPRCRPVLDAAAEEVTVRRVSRAAAGVFPAWLYACRGPRWRPVPAGRGVGYYAADGT